MMVELLDLKLLIGLSTELNFEQRPTEDFARSRQVCFTKHLVFQKIYKVIVSEFDVNPRNSMTCEGTSGPFHKNSYHRF